MSLLLSLTILGVTLSSTQSILLTLPILFIIYTFWLHSGRPIGNPLVWSWIPHLRSAVLFGQDPNAFLLACKKQYGNTFTVNLGGKVSDEDARTLTSAS